MVRRPKEWEKWTQEQRMKWLRSQRTQYKGGRKRTLRKEDSQRVWALMKKTDNMSMTADILGCDRTTMWRFLKRHPTPKTFVVEESMLLKDFPEIQFWLTRMEGYAGPRTISSYMTALRKFFEYQKEYHPERAKPSLWTSDDALKFIFGDEKTGWKGMPKGSWHFNIVPIRSLALKAKTEFPQIDLGLLPTKKTHKAKRSLAGKKEYYYTPQEVDAMIMNVSTLKAKALIATLYNLAPRTEAVTEIEHNNLSLEEHRLLIQDKGSIYWDTYGMNERTAQLLRLYLAERGTPKTKWLFVNNGNGKETKMTQKDVNNIIREAGKKAGITDKVLTAKAFRKSFVENYFEIPDADPMILTGSGKGTQDQPKTAFCVGWSLKILMEHYAPKMRSQIDTHRQKFNF